MQYISFTKIQVSFHSKQLLPLVFLKASYDKSLVHQNRPLHQHAIRGKQREYFLIIHFRQPILQLHLLVKRTAGIHKALNRQSAPVIPFSQLFYSRILLFYISLFIGNALLIQPFLRFFACPAFRIFYIQHSAANGCNQTKRITSRRCMCYNALITVSAYQLSIGN